jgi:peroxiredoxin
MKLQIGQQAPIFTLKSHLGREYTLSEFRGKNVVIAFFPLAFTPI